MRAVRALLARLLFAFLVFVLTGEAALRIVYRDQGRRTLFGPGFQPFEHTGKDASHRGRFETGPQVAGVPRILVVGDSISYGQGVRNWRDVWPEIMVARLRARGRPHELAVVAEPGHNLDDHLREFDRWAAEVRPDIFIYQFFVNDIDIFEDQEPDLTRWWQRLPWHPRLRASYLYYVLEDQLWRRLPPPAYSYVDHLQTRFVPGTLEGEAFEHVFRELAGRARAQAPERWLLMYPLVPFTGAYPLQAIHDRMRALAEAEGFRVVDPTAALTGFNTHVSLFDGHPNEPAQRVLGEAMAGALAAAHPD